MLIISAVPTAQALVYWPQYFAGLMGAWDAKIKYFKIGEGGWIDPGTGVRQPRIPDPSLTDLDCIVNPARYPGSTFVYTKTLLGTDLTYAGANTIAVRCFLDLLEANDDGSGGIPEFWEIGAYTDHPTIVGGKLMVAYATMPMQQKTAAVTKTNVIQIAFNGQ